MTQIRSRRVLAFAASLLVGFVGCQQEIAPAPGPPNLIVILTDDQGADDWQGRNPRIHTPELVRLADDGFELTNFHATPACSPSRVALLTGRHALRTRAMLLLPGAPAKQRSLRPREITIAQLLRRVGYQTGLVGKWHLSHRAEDVAQAGFGSFYGFLEGDTSYVDPENLYRNVQRLGRVEGYSSDLFAGEAEAFIRRHRDVPFFLLLALNAPHEVVEGHPDDLEHYPADSFSPRQRHTYATLTSADRALGRVRSVVEELDLSRRTVVIFTSDNGAAGVQKAKGSLYRAGAHVPFVAWAPGRIRAGSSDALTSITDLFATLLTWAGTSPPDDLVLDGSSLAPIFQGASPTAARRTLVQSWLKGYAIFDDRHRLILHHDPNLGPRAELFDLASDPREDSNLLHTDYARAHPVFERLRADLVARVRHLRGDPEWDLQPFRE